MVTIQQQQQPHVQAQSTNLQLSLQSITRGSDQCLNPTAITPVINTTFLNGSVAVSSLTNQMYMNGTSNQVSNNISQLSDLSKSGSVSGSTSQNATINHLLALLVSRQDLNIQHINSAMSINWIHDICLRYCDNVNTDFIIFYVNLGTSKANTIHITI